MSTQRPLYPREAVKEWLRSTGRMDSSEQATPSLDELIDVVFFASLEREEGAFAPVRVVYHKKGIEGLKEVNEAYFVGDGQGSKSAWKLVPFQRDRGVTELTVKTLAKIAPAANLPRTAVVVGTTRGRLMIQGLARRVAYTYYRSQGEESTVVFCAPRPGHVSLLVRGEEVFRYESGFIIDVPHRPRLFDLLNDKDSAIQAALRQICAKMIAKLPPTRFLAHDSYHLVAQAVAGLVEQMCLGKHGGLIAILPNKTSEQNEVVAGKYRLMPTSRSILRAAIEELAEVRHWNMRSSWESAATVGSSESRGDYDPVVAQEFDDEAESDVRQVAENIGQLSTIDNALLLGQDLEVLSAGYPIPSSSKLPVVFEASTLAGDCGARFPLLRHGSRHRAAVNFAHRYRGGLAFLCSQDGDLRILHRPEKKRYVLVWTVSRLEW